MKNLSIFILSLLFVGNLSFAQSKKYVASMEKAITQMDTAKTAQAIQKAANMFERIMNAESEEWLPAYYNAMCQIRLASIVMEKGETDKKEPLIDQAQAAVDHALKVAPNESEVLTLQGYIYICRIWGNEMTLGAKYTPMAHEAFAKAIAIDANNPRTYYLRGQLIFYTPDFFGGGAKNAMADLKKADELYASYEKASSIHPDWGKGSNTYHLEKAKASLADNN